MKYNKKQNKPSNHKKRDFINFLQQTIDSPKYTDTSHPEVDP